MQLYKQPTPQPVTGQAAVPIINHCSFGQCWLVITRTRKAARWTDRYQVTIHYSCVITPLVTMMRLSRRSVWSLAVCVTAVMWGVEVEPRVTSQAATYKVDRDR